jgi:hypothetical protein
MFWLRNANWAVVVRCVVALFRGGTDTARNTAPVNRLTDHNQSALLRMDPTMPLAGTLDSGKMLVGTTWRHFLTDASAAGMTSTSKFVTNAR